jgi:hypothetical protein
MAVPVTDQIFSRRINYYAFDRRACLSEQLYYIGT